MGSTDQDGGEVDQGTRVSQLRDALIQHAEGAWRLGDDHYLVPWQPVGQLWCVINMATLDAHAEDCAAFRHCHDCEHLDLIRELCTRERARDAGGGARTPGAAQQQARFVDRTGTPRGADPIAMVRR